MFSLQIRDRLIERPDLQVVIITDELNKSYNSHEALYIDFLADYGAEIIYTDLERLRDPNLLYSGMWRMFFQWFGQEGTGWLPNPSGETSPDVTIRSYLQLVNAKANHRKAIITENHGLVLSANAHDASAFHSNVAAQVSGPIIKDMVEAERSVAAFSGGDLHAFPSEKELEGLLPAKVYSKEETIEAQIITEGQVETHLLAAIHQLEAGDQIWIGMFYLSDRTIIRALLDAAERGIFIRVVLDPNENAFGSQKMGMPNIPVSRELAEDSGGRIQIKWYHTNKEQYHPKIAYLRGEDKSYVTLGSTNFTSRNLKDYNLENNIAVTAPNRSRFIQDVDDYFDRIWGNEDTVYTVPFDMENDEFTLIRYAIYWMQKILRFTTY
jgi:phosphatidylserine/phosphatidylglycerophosphate/cardiolipin synthase-like enzyme